MREYSEQGHRAAAPALPGTDALERTKADARLRAASVAPRRGGIGAPLLVAAAVVVALGAAVVGTTHVVKTSQPVFAKAKALESLQLPTQGVMHTKRTTPPSSAAGIVQTVDEWFDLDRHAYRSETHGVAGRLVELSVMSDGRMTSLWSLDPFADTVVTSDSAKARESQEFGLKFVRHQQALGAKDDLYYSMASDIRHELDTGEAKISGPVDYHGVQCWVVGYGDLLAGGTRQYQGLLRTGDYSLVCWRQCLDRRPAMEMEFAHETLDRQKLPSDFFSLDVPASAVPSKQILERQHVSSLPLNGGSGDTSESVNGSGSSSAKKK